MDNEYKRKGIHIINGLWVFVLPFFQRTLAVLLVFIAFIYVFFLARPNSRFGSFFSKSFDNMARPVDKNKGFLVGPTIYVVMVLIMIGFIDFRIAGAVFAILAFGDGFATIFGRKIGKHRLSNGKSIEGSIAFFLFSFVSSIAVFMLINQFNTPSAGWTIIQSLILPSNLNLSLIFLCLIFISITLILTFIELFMGDFMNDNLLIPICGSTLFYLFFGAMLIFQHHV